MLILSALRTFIWPLLFSLGGVIFGALNGAAFAARICWILAAITLLYAGLTFVCRLPGTRLVPLFFVLRLLRTLLLVVLLAGFVSFVVIEAMIFSGSKSDPEVPVDAIVVLGAGLYGEIPSPVLRSRLDAALPLIERQPGVPVIVTGGQGEGEDIPEALAMQRYLVAKGVPAERIVLEDRSTSTEGNFALSLPLLPEGARRVAVVSNDYHLYRARMIAEDCGLEPVAVAAPSPYFYLTVTGYLREYFALSYRLLGGAVPEVADMVERLRPLLSPPPLSPDELLSDILPSIALSPTPPAVG